MNEELEELKESLEIEDVGQKRYIMYLIADKVIEKIYTEKDVDMPEPDERIEELKEVDGYVYKLVQDFFTSSSTHDKQEKIEKLLEKVQD